MGITVVIDKKFMANDIEKNDIVGTRLFIEES